MNFSQQRGQVSYLHFQDLSVLVWVVQLLLEYGKFKSPHRESALPPTYFQVLLTLFQTTHFEETTLTQTHVANLALNQP